MKKISDEAAAGIFAFIWEGFLYLGLFIELATGSNVGYYLWALDTAVQLTILYYDNKLDKAEKALRKTRKKLAKQSADFTEYVRTHSTTEDAPEPKRTVIFDIKSLIESRKRKGA